MFHRQSRSALIVFLLLALNVFLISPLFAGPLADKARLFDRLVAENHVFGGLVYDVREGPGGQPQLHGAGDSCIWTGGWAAALAYRYRATHDPEALRLLETTLRGYSTLQRITGDPGFAGRSWGKPDWFPDARRMRPGVASYSHLVYVADTSRDQYIGMFLAYALGTPLMEGSDTRRLIQEDLRAIGRRLMRDNLALITVIDGVRSTQFNLNPDYCYQDRINPVEWATVDDFPANVFASIVPFDDRLAAGLSTFRPPPIRGGETWRALLMMSTAARYADDPELERFYRDELRGRRQLARVASETSQMISDLEAGINRPVWKRTLGGLYQAFWRTCGEVVDRLGMAPRCLLRLLAPLCLECARMRGEHAADLLFNALDLLRKPGSFVPLHKPAEFLESLSNTLISLGIKKPAERLRKIASRLHAMAISNLDEFFDAQRSYVGTNITYFAMLGILESNPDPELASAARDCVDRAFLQIADEKNALYTYIRAAFGATPLDPVRLAEAKETMLDYPTEQVDKRFDHRGDAGLRLLPWPDRFGRVGNQAVRPFPLSQRAPDIFPWQRDLRDVTSGGDGKTHIAPVGYLLAYWFARSHGLLTSDD
ncbi:MAG: hypothetical protein WA705_25805 [Candidatus Ozemobacteraceae bacterium]